MFGYVTPCRMELKVKDFEKFKAYYCGLCHTIKKDYGNIPRMTLNYDMTFLAILLDSLNDKKLESKRFTCALHPFQKKIHIINNESLKYAARCNIVLTYYKLIDNINDDNALKSKIASVMLKRYINDGKLSDLINNSLNNLYIMEKEAYKYSIDEISHGFADLTGSIIAGYIEEETDYKEQLYWLGYNLGKWIYIIDAWDDLEKDMKGNKFNLISKLYNTDNRSCTELKNLVEDRIDFILTSCGAACLETLACLPLKKNKELLINILELGLMEKMDTVFKRSELVNGESI
ncbi:MAG: DUF5685 family protein [Bacillota bacterium]|nr:DUF5685 family protein [Bacillota bacterium]